uniref:Uncharacterized protein n=1 Tax=Anguilla anguilla TaxID=7936 RepID=A0A0E9XXH5_ANGAN
MQKKIPRYQNRNPRCKSQTLPLTPINTSSNKQKTNLAQFERRMKFILNMLY